MKSREAQEQATVIQWCNLQSKKYRELDLIYHCPNGGKRNKREAHNLKLEGVKAGVPDLFLPVARNGKHGLYIEMKWGKNTCTEKQVGWLRRLRHQGYEAVVAYGADEAIQVIKDYLNIK